MSNADAASIGVAMLRGSSVARAATAGILSTTAMTLVLLAAACDSRPPPVAQRSPPTVPAPPVVPAQPAVAGASQAPVRVDVPALLVSGRCHLCHDATRPVLGPSYHDIARTYAARREVMLEILAHKIIDGGGGNWGVVPMVPGEQFTIDEAKAMAEWILDSLRDRESPARNP